MADEVTQAVELEVKGFYYLLKGTLASLRFMAKQINAFHNWRKENYSSGEKSWAWIKANSDGSPQVIQVPDSLLTRENGKVVPNSEFMAMLDKHHIPYAILPDTITGDNKVPFMFRPQDIAIVSELVNAKKAENIERNEKKKDECVSKIEQLQEQLNQCTDPEIAKDLEYQIDCERLKEDNLNKAISNDKADLENPTMSFEEYLKTSKGTELYTNPALALAKESNGIPLQREFTFDELAVPIRSKELVPESGVAFWSIKDEQNNVTCFTQTFHVDENDNVYSVFKIGDNEFSDKGILSKDYKEQLGNFCKENNIDLDLKIRVDVEQECSREFSRYYSEENFKNKVDTQAGEETGLTKQELMEGNTVAEKRDVSKSATHEADVNKMLNTQKSETVDEIIQKKANVATYTYDKSRFISNGTGMNLQLNDGSRIKLDGHAGMTEDGSFKIAINKDREYTLEHVDGKTEKISGQLAQNLINNDKFPNMTKQVENKAQSVAKTVAKR